MRKLAPNGLRLPEASAAQTVSFKSGYRKGCYQYPLDGLPVQDGEFVCEQAQPSCGPTQFPSPALGTSKTVEQKLGSIHLREDEEEGK
jgi:hypothetical protein